LQTSHVAECPDVAPECATTLIPAHEHHARVGLTHFDLVAQYGLREHVQLSLRLPYDIKAMSIRYTTLAGAPFTPPYGDIHHRTETLSGIGDPTLSVEVSRGPMIFGGGLSLPLGRIEPDPIDLGARGLQHQHMQFGTGVVQPVVSAQWSDFRWSAFAEARLSLYENREGLRSPHVFLWSAGPSFDAGPVTIDPRLSGQYQTIGRWNGVVDENSGFHSGGLRVQVSVPWRDVVVAPAVRRELWSKSLHHEESFTREWTWSVTVVRTF
jgi:hypothetical protein